MVGLSRSKIELDTPAFHMSLVLEANILMVLQ